MSETEPLKDFYEQDGHALNVVEGNQPIERCDHGYPGCAGGVNGMISIKIAR